DILGRDPANGVVHGRLPEFREAGGPNGRPKRSRAYSTARPRRRQCQPGRTASNRPYSTASEPWALVTMPSPPEGEGCKVSQHNGLGEGVSSQKVLLTKRPLTPSVPAGSFLSPSPSGGEGLETRAPDLLTQSNLLGCGNDAPECGAQCCRIGCAIGGFKFL